MYSFWSFRCCFNWVHWDVIVWVAAITFGLSTVVWEACQFDFSCVPVDVRVVLHKPGVSQDDCLMANAQDIEFGPALVSLVLDNKIDCFSDFSDLVWRSVCIIQPNQMWELIGLKLMCSDKLMVNKFSHCTAVYQCFHLLFYFILFYIILATWRQSPWWSYGSQYMRTPPRAYECMDW